MIVLDFAKRRTVRRAIVLLVSVFIVVAVVVAHGVWYRTSGVYAAPSDPTDDSCFNFNVPTKTILSYYDIPECPKDVVIPYSIGGTAVEHIGYAAFAHKDMESVIVPDSVLSIGDHAFRDNNISHLELGSSVATFGYAAFLHNELEELVLSDSVTSIGEFSFNSNRLRSVAFGNSLVVVSDHAFSRNEIE